MSSKKRSKKKKTSSRSKQRKFIFVVGGVMSGVGKGVTTSSIGMLMKARGYSTTAIKIDPYINVDAGTMNPTEHGEVFVLEDGDETDQDMGNYERFLDTTLTRANYMTTGRVYQSVIGRERNLKYKGKCVQVVPHIPLEVIARIKKASENARADITVIEIGGTAGEYENILFLETARMLELEHPGDVSFVMVSYVPTPQKVGEMKTKPTQHAVRALNSTGIQPDVIIARSETPMDTVRKEKIATFCNISKERVISAPDVESVYDVPINFEKDHLSDILLRSLSLKNKNKTDLGKWKSFVAKTKNTKKKVKIAIVGKYFQTGGFVLTDAYISVIEAIKYSAWKEGANPEIHWLCTEDYEGRQATGNLKKLSKYDGIIVPGGFGSRGVDGKLSVIKYAREKKIPYLGLCYGMQLAVIEFARNVAGIKNASTPELNPDSKDLVVDIMPDQKKKMEEENYGGTMRLGAYPAILKKGSLAYRAYITGGASFKTKKRQIEISERHRHRYEVNSEYAPRLEEKGLIFSGKSPDEKLMEIIELSSTDHPFFVASQFHPEFQARPLSPHPLFTGLIRAGLKRKKK